MVHAAIVSQNSLCKATQFPCSLSGPCIPLADLCNGIGDCPNGQDEARCSESIQMLHIAIGSIPYQGGFIQ